MRNFFSKHNLLLLLFICCSLFAFELNSAVLPAHDTMLIFQYFDFVYSHYQEYGDIPRWLPNSGYGLPAFLYQQSFLNINKYLVLLLGTTFDVKNVLILYKFSLLLDRLVFVVGIYLLSTRLYDTVLARWYLGVTSIAALSIYYQAFFNLYIFYLLPLILYCIVSFIQTQRSKYIAFGAFIGSLHLWGHTIYFIPLQFYILLFVFILYSAVAFPRKVYFDKLSIALLLGVALFSSFFIYLIYQSIEGIVSVAHSRQENFSVALPDFLTYARLNLGQMIQGYLTGSGFQDDNTYYIGLLPLVIMVWGTVKSKSIGFWVFTIMSIFLLSFSVGGAFSKLYYYLPSMDRYRHIGLVFGILSVFVLIGSAFFVEELSSKIKQEKPGWLRGAALIFFSLVVVDIIITHGILTLPVFAESNLFTHAFLVKMSVLFVIILISWRVRFELKYKIRIFAAFLIMDAVTYQYAVIQHMPKTEADIEAFSMVKKYDFSKPRFDHTKPSDDKSVLLIDSFDNFSKTIRNAVYDVTFDWIGAGPCVPFLRTDRWNPYALKAIRARGGIVNPYSGDSFFREGDAGFAQSLGCVSPKLYFAHTFEVVLQDENEVFADIEDPSRDILIHQKPSLLKTGDTLGQDASINVLSHSAHKIEFEANVEGVQPVLLVYADAWDPRWSATVNGLSVPVLRANVGFKAIELKPGLNLVNMQFAKNHPMTMFNKVAFLFALLVATMIVILVYRECKQQKLTETIA